MTDTDRLRLSAYLDQEAMRVRDQWFDTDPSAKIEFMNWLAQDHSIEPTDVPPAWLQFATRCALLQLQTLELSN